MTRTEKLIAAAEAAKDMLVVQGPAGTDINRGAKGKGMGVRIWPSGQITRNDTDLSVCQAMTPCEAAHLLGLKS